MALVSMKEMLKDAQKRQYAVGCFNSINLDMIRGIIEAAEAEKSPVILCHAEIHFKFTPLEKIAPIIVEEAKNAKVPVAILLDHGMSFSAMVKAMHLGFNAIMFDGSELNYDENVKRTKEIVKIAKELGVSVEAELGHVVRPKSGGAEGEEDDSIIDDRSLYTDPQQAKKFIEETQADSLAIAFGTAHGVYLKKPKLDLERLNKIKQMVDVPLVMHGGSGLSEVDFQNSIDNGISKINYYTNMALSTASKIKEEMNKSDGNVFYHNLMMWSIKYFKEDVRKTMRVFRSNNKA